MERRCAGANASVSASWDLTFPTPSKGSYTRRAAPSPAHTRANPTSPRRAGGVSPKEGVRAADTLPPLSVWGEKEYRLHPRRCELVYSQQIV